MHVTALLLRLTLLCAALVVGPARWAGADELRNKSQKINVALKQSTLLESMTQTACFAMSGLQRRENRSEALDQIDSFGTALAGLREGHEWLGLRPETHPAALQGLGVADQSWTRFRPVIQQLVNGDNHSVVVQQLLSDSSPAQHITNALSQEMIKAHGHDLSVRMQTGLFEAAAHRMRVQRSLSELCFVMNGIGGAQMADRLTQTLSQIDAGFTYLAEGNGTIPKAPNARVQRNLRTAALFWGKMRPNFDLALSGQGISEATLRKTLKFNKSVLKQLNQAVEGYLPQP